MSLQALTAKDLAQKVLQKDDLYILDVRNENDYKDWGIEGENVMTENVPYFGLIDGVDHIIERIPTDREVLVVCAKEGASKFVAEQLLEKMNRTIYYLAGGMKTWSEHLEPVKIGDLKDGGTLYQFARIGKGCLSYLVESGGEGAIIDATRMIDTYEQFAKEHNVQIKHLLDTHLHADHISGGRKLAERSGGKYLLPPKDAGEVVFDYTPLAEGQVITVGTTELKIEAIYSPGHTIGSTSLIVDNKYLITGDILFIDSIGRPDLAGKAEDWVSDLRTTLYEMYTKLDPNLYVLPAHYAKLHEMDDTGRVCARLGDLYEKNSGLNIENEAEFRQIVTQNLPPQPNAYQEIRQTNMGKITPEEDEQTEMEIGPNRCAVS